MINYLYLVENECIIAELTPEKVKERREKKDVTLLTICQPRGLYVLSPSSASSLFTTAARKACRWLWDT
jgi:hypothetical protein